ncbi:MAG TPA: hypothetical protein VMZ00_15585 [Sporichthya sp.]|nr:hypothetical protein [Sporichthya sp.]
MRLPRFGAVLLTAALLAGCGDSGTSTPSPSSPPSRSTPSAVPSGAPKPSTPAAATKVALGKDFRLEEGRTARIEGTDLAVTFTRLVGDSRCPTNLTCIQQGEATIEIRVVALGSSQSFELSAPGSAGANEKHFGKFVIQLQAVEPWPTDPAGSPGGQADVPVVAVLRVLKHG